MQLLLNIQVHARIRICTHLHTHTHTHTVYTHMQSNIPLLLLSQFWCCRSCLEGHIHLPFHGAWQGWKESLDSTKSNAELSRFQDGQLLPYLIFDVHISSSFEEQSAYLHMAFLTGHVQSRPATGLYTHNEQWSHDPCMQTQTNLVCDVWIGFTL